MRVQHANSAPPRVTRLRPTTIPLSWYPSRLARRTMIKLGSFPRQVPYRTIRPSVRGRSELNVCARSRIKRQHLVGSLRQCVCCVECDPPQTGVSMWGGLRWPVGPFQVICVLAAAVLAAGFSTATAFAQQPPLPDNADVDRIGERLNADTVAIVDDQWAVHDAGDNQPASPSGRASGRRA